MKKSDYNPLYDNCPTCLGATVVCGNCEGTEGPDLNDSDNNCECTCTVFEPEMCLDCDGLGYLSDLEDDEEDDEEEEDEEDDEEDDEGSCDLCDGTGEVETDDGEMEDCECLEDEF